MDIEDYNGLRATISDFNIWTRYNHFEENNYNKLKTAKANFELAGEIIRINNIKYKEGLISSLDLSQAESQYFDAQQKYFQAIYELLNSKIALDKSMSQF